MIISEWNSNKINGFWQWIKKWVQLLIRFYNDTVCIHDHNITLQRVHIGTWNQIIFKLAKHMHPTQRSHSKTHWICIEIFQTKHEAWGCFKLNITPLYNKKWSSGLLFFFFPTWNNNQHTKKCLHANFLQMSNSTVVQ